MAWRKMAELNASDPASYNPFHHTETVQATFLRTQGLLQGPSISHFSMKISTSKRSWFDIAEEDRAFQEALYEVFASAVSCNTLSSDLQTPSTQTTSMQESLDASTTTWGENVRRNPHEVEEVVADGDLFADHWHKQYFHHLGDLFSTFIDFDIQKWHAISNCEPKRKCSCPQCTDSPDLC